MDDLIQEWERRAAEAQRQYRLGNGPSWHYEWQAYSTCARELRERFTGSSGPAGIVASEPEPVPVPVIVVHPPATEGWGGPAHSTPLADLRSFVASMQDKSSPSSSAGGGRGKAERIGTGSGKPLLMNCRCQSIPTPHTLLKVSGETVAEFCAPPALVQMMVDDIREHTRRIMEPRRADESYPAYLYRLSGRQRPKLPPLFEDAPADPFSESGI